MLMIELLDIFWYTDVDLRDRNHYHVVTSVDGS